MSREKLNEFLEKHPVVSVWSITPIGTGINHGIRRSVELPDIFSDPEFEIERLTWEEEQMEVWFSIDYTSYRLTAAELLSDKWGNAGTWESLELEEGCFEFAFSDDTTINVHPDWAILMEGYSFDEGEFLLFVEEKYPDFVSTIGEELVCNGCRSDWKAYTTNKPADSPEWRRAADAFVNSLREEGAENAA